MPQYLVEVTRQVEERGSTLIKAKDQADAEEKSEQLLMGLEGGDTKTLGLFTWDLEDEAFEVIDVFEE